MLRRFDAVWTVCLRWLLGLWISRASLASVIVGSILFVFTDAVHDLLRSIVQELANRGWGSVRIWYPMGALLLWSFLWAMVVHYMARVLLWIDLGRLPAALADRSCYDTPFTWIPRALGMAAIASVSLGLLLTSCEGQRFDPAGPLPPSASRVQQPGNSPQVAAPGVAPRAPSAESGRLLEPAVTGQTANADALRQLVPVDETFWLRLLAGVMAAEAMLFLAYAYWRDELLGLIFIVLTPAGLLLSLIAPLMPSAVGFTGRLRIAVSRLIWPLLGWLLIKQPIAGATDVQPVFVPSAAGNQGRNPPVQPINAATAGDLWRLFSVFLALTFLGFGSMLWAMISPISLAEFVTPNGLLMLLLATWIPFFSVLAFLDHWRRFPMVVPVVIVCLLAQCDGIDRHALRLLPDDAGAQQASERPDLPSALAGWSVGNSTSDPVPFIIVATAGGGSRAGYWTATILGMMQDTVPDFRKRLFAISAVSGGALGAAAFSALLERDDALSATTRFCRGSNGYDIDREGATRFRRCGQTITGADFLAPSFAAFGYQDAIFWALPVVPASLVPDRAIVIEQTWEKAWRDTVDPGGDGGAPDLFAGRFADAARVSSNGPWRPLLLFNGTSVATGKRIVASQLDFARDPAMSLIIDSYDLFHELGLHAAGRLRLSTAITVAARFPYVLPAGSLGGGVACPSSLCDRVVDGGYFENFGAATALDLLTAIFETTLKQQQDTDGKAKWLLQDNKTWVKPVVIQISSDPGFDDTAAPPTPVPTDTRWWAELASPPETLFDTQSARGVLAMNSLRRRAQTLGIRFIHFNMHGDGKPLIAPLSWSLSRAAQSDIERRVCDKKNRDALDELGAALAVTDINGKIDDQLCR